MIVRPPADPFAGTAQRPRALRVAPELRLPGLSVVLPCHDEEANVVQAIGEALDAAERCAWDVEVIVVDDGSGDSTRRAAELVASHDVRVRVVGHAANRGYGAAVRTGIAASRMSWVLLTDGDLQFDLRELVRMLPAAAVSDIVAGYRIGRCDPWPRRLAAAAWNVLVRRTFGLAVRDVDCAFKLVRGPRLRALELRSDGAMISAELYACARRGCWRIAEVGVNHRPRLAGRPSGGRPAVVLRALRERRALARVLAVAGDNGARRDPSVVPRPRSGTIGT